LKYIGNLLGVVIGPHGLDSVEDSLGHSFIAGVLILDESDLALHRIPNTQIKSIKIGRSSRLNVKSDFKSLFEAEFIQAREHFVD